MERHVKRKTFGRMEANVKSKKEPEFYVFILFIFVISWYECGYEEKERFTSLFFYIFSPRKSRYKEVEEKKEIGTVKQRKFYFSSHVYLESVKLREKKKRRAIVY